MKTGNIKRKSNSKYERTLSQYISDAKITLVYGDVSNLLIPAENPFGCRTLFSPPERETQRRWAVSVHIMKSFFRCFTIWDVLHVVKHGERSSLVGADGVAVVVGVVFVSPRAAERSRRRCV